MLKIFCFAILFVTVNCRGIQPHLRPHTPKHYENALEKLTEYELETEESNVIQNFQPDSVEEYMRGDNEVDTRLVIDDSSEDEGSCSVGTEVKPLGSYAIHRHHVNIMTAMDMKCDGNVTSWEFYARGKGLFYASIWREEGVGHYTLIGKNLINATRVGRRARDIRAKDQIRVQKGDVIGIHYPKKLPKYQRCGVLAFENQLMEANCGDLELTWIKHYSDSWRCGSDVRFDMMAYRRIAIRANVKTTGGNMQLENGI